MKILITGSAGFIAFHLATALIKEGHNVIGLDILNEYYDINLKHSRLQEHGINFQSLILNNPQQSTLYQNYKFIKSDICNKQYLIDFMKDENFDIVVNLAAQAGVRYSITNPDVYIKSNIEGFLNILEGCRHSNVGHLIYASTSSVYGLNTKMPLKEDQTTDHPMTLYAATKKSNELMAHSYSHLYGLPTTGLRFFTVYGPWGRPDMALFLFTKAILSNQPINLFNNGKMIRDFTYVLDIVESIKRLCDFPAKSNPNWNGSNPQISSSSAPYKIFNIGNNNPIEVFDYINALEKALQKKAIYNLLPMQLGDVPITHADVSSLQNQINFTPSTDIYSGVKEFVIWYKNYYKI